MTTDSPIDIACPACGRLELPQISAAALHARCGRNAVALPPLPGGELPVMGGGCWYRMREAAWADYRLLCDRAAPFSFFSMEACNA